MNDFIDKYSWTLIEFIVGFFSITLIMSIFSDAVILNNHSINSIDQSLPVPHTSYNVPIIEENDFVVTNAIVEKDSVFNWKDYVNIQTEYSLDLFEYIVVEGEVDTSHPGAYPLLFRISFNGVSIIKEATFYVREG